MKNYLLYIIFLCSIGFCGCSKSELKPNEYIDWFENPDNKMVKKFNQNSLELTCQYETPDFVYLKQNGSENIDEITFEENKNELKDLIHFKLKFRDTLSNNFLRNNYTTLEEFNTKSMYLSYDIQYDLKLVKGNDTLPCVMNHHERTYGSTPYETILIAFQNVENSKSELELIFNDRVFGFGRVKFFFSKDELNEIPELKL